MSKKQAFDLPVKITPVDTEEERRCGKGIH